MVTESLRVRLIITTFGRLGLELGAEML